MSKFQFTILVFLLEFFELGGCCLSDLGFHFGRSFAIFELNVFKFNFEVINELLVLSLI